MVERNGTVKGMVLAAGLGTRMRPITDTKPKPLVEIAGRTLLDRALDALRGAGIRSAVVNAHYRAEQIVAHLKSVTDLETVVSDETDCLMDSGGGVVKALPFLGDQPFVVLNADTFWIDDPSAGSNLARLIARFEPDSMDMLMLVADPARASGHESQGDFSMNADGSLKRYDGRAGNPVIYAGALIVHPRIFADAPDVPFSLNRIFDEALRADRMRGLLLDGHWITVGTPDAIDAAERALATHESATAPE